LTRRPVLSAAAGALAIAFSAPLVRLAEVSPSTAAVFRCAYALPLLALLAWLERRRHGPANRQHGRLAMIAGFFFAADLTFWHHSIEAVGAGLATVLANVQVVLVGLLAWALLKERPDVRSMRAVPLVLFGVVLISGVVGSGAYGDDPALGVLYGMLTALAYAVFLLILRGAGGAGLRPAGPLFLATFSAAVFALLGGVLVGDFDAVPAPDSQAWLVTLALTSQVLGWLLISIALPRVPALLTSIVLTIQPVGSVILGVLIFGESPSAFQFAGVVLILSGVILATARSRPQG
jgi:drug/metabolite transporter (DMT)-like permease